MSTSKVKFSVWSAVVLLTIAVTARAGGPNWPGFRGDQGRGVQEDVTIPATWNVETGENVKWKTRIPGLAHSSPVVWGDKIFLTSAVSGNLKPYLRVGLYGESPEHDEEIEHDFRVYCLDKSTGKIIWEKTAHTGIPKVKRHVKSTHANSTPATDGKYVVAFFGSEGLYCYDYDGNLVWEKDLGLLDSGAFNAKEIQWAFGSSPTIYDGRVYIQCDVNNQSFVACYELADGKKVWRKKRNETPGWGTPTIHESDGRTQMIVNGYKHIGGYDIKKGKVLWRMKGGGDIPVPTPFVAHGLIFISSAHGPERPIYAIRTDAKGEIKLSGRGKSAEYVAWKRDNRGSYIPTPIVYGDYLYVCDDRGVLTCYEAETGKQVYRERVAGSGGAFSASAVAADGKVFFTGEEGDIYVIKAGPKFERLATNSIGEVCLATPAIADDTIYIRSRDHLFAIGK